MAVKNVGEKYKCNICGNEVTVTKAGGGTLDMLRQIHGENRLGLAGLVLIKGHGGFRKVFFYINADKV